MKNHCKCGKKLTGNEKSCPDCKRKKQQTLDSLEKFVKYDSFALAGLSLVLKIAKSRQS
ncbi:hypothetical protein IGI96_002737 [Enterococcus sp. DIV0421]